MLDKAPRSQTHSNTSTHQYPCCSNMHVSTSHNCHIGFHVGFFSQACCTWYRESWSVLGSFQHHQPVVEASMRTERTILTACTRCKNCLLLCNSYIQLQSKATGTGTKICILPPFWFPLCIKLLFEPVKHSKTVFSAMVLSFAWGSGWD